MTSTFSAGDLVLVDIGWLSGPALVLYDRDPGKSVVSHVKKNTWSDSWGIYVDEDGFSRCLKGDPNYIILTLAREVCRISHSVAAERIELIRVHDALG